MRGWPWFCTSDKPTTTFEDAQAAKIAELTRSRRAVADAYEVERQRIERDLHDGAQQHLVAAAIRLGEVSLDAEGDIAALIEAAKADIDAGLRALRHTVRGVSSQLLHDRGLVPALNEAASSYGSHVVVQAPHPLPELSPSVLAAAYFFTTEAMTNAAKYAPGAPVSILVTADTDLRIRVVDEGPGGASFIAGGGLAGMRDRLTAFGGTMRVNSPVGGPTRVSADIPLLLNRGEAGIVTLDQES